MGKRRRKLLSKKFHSLPWNKHNKKSEETQEPLIAIEMPKTIIQEPESTTMPIEKPNFKNMTKKDLIKFAKESDVEIKTSMTKAKIVEILEQS